MRLIVGAAVGFFVAALVHTSADNDTDRQTEKIERK